MGRSLLARYVCDECGRVWEHTWAEDGQQNVSIEPPRPWHTFRPYHWTATVTADVVCCSRRCAVAWIRRLGPGFNPQPWPEDWPPDPPSLGEESAEFVVIQQLEVPELDLEST